jgi:hypothetical protein
LPFRSGLERQPVGGSQRPRIAGDFDLARGDAQLRMADLKADVDKLDVVIGPRSDRILARRKRHLGASLNAAQDFQQDSF